MYANGQEYHRLRKWKRGHERDTVHICEGYCSWREQSLFNLLTLDSAQ